MAIKQRITTSGQLFTGRGVIEVVSLGASTQNSFADLYDGLYKDGPTTGAHLWHIRTLANDYRITPILTIPYDTGIFGIIAGTGAGLEVSVR